jgi:hypothetical protein
MKKRWKRLMSFSMFVFLVFPGFFGLMAEEPPVEAVQAAQKGICDIPFHLPGNASPDNAVIGHGFQVYSVPPMTLVNSSALRPVIAPLGLWRFVVVADGSPVALITAAQVEGNWRAVSMGGARLAAEVHQVMEQWPSSKGYNHRFVRIFQARADFIEVSRKGEPFGFVPLTASRLAFGLEGPFDAGVILQESEVLTPLQRIVKEKMPGLEEKK